ncbi:MAG: alpha-amylase [Saprospirales bacterium]|nr:MAG: alpha-amylase [Saprospirales bacterium]
MILLRTILLFAFCLLTTFLLHSQEMIYETESDLSREEQERRLPPGTDRSPHYFPPLESRFSESRINPPYWWTGMNNPVVELLIYKENVAHFNPSISHPGIKIIEVVSLDNPNYLILKIELKKDAQPGAVSLDFRSKVEPGDFFSMDWELKERTGHHKNMGGLHAGDVIYLIMPDRFANGDYSNDSFDDMNQQGIDRRRVFYRHGGDLQGIIDNLDYLEGLGVTALWLNPVMENDQPYESYHGYAITDHYRVDRRLGSNDLYRELSEKAMERGIKMVHDVIYNHMGDHHWIFRDIPSEDWFHWHEEFQRTTYRSTTLMDPYAAQTDREIFETGWFDNHMPDINQRNERVARFLIQNTIWSIETFKLNGLRIDTYPYSDLEFMINLVEEVYSEYPDIGIFGETWVQSTGVQSWYGEQTNPFAEFNSNLAGLTDFQLYYAILEALNKPQGWTTGIEEIYYTLAQDHLYKDPFQHVTFVDNHDLDRFLSAVDEDMDKFRAGLVFLFTTRGIPMLYYGTEIAMKNRANPDGWVRESFPGGWEEDEVNKFTAEGRTHEEEEIFNFVQKLIELRTSEAAFQCGDLIQFIPRDGVYAFFRKSGSDVFLVILNTSGEGRGHSLDRYLAELDGKDYEITDRLNGGTRLVGNTVDLPATGALILQLEAR